MVTKFMLHETHAHYLHSLHTYLNKSFSLKIDTIKNRTKIVFFFFVGNGEFNTILPYGIF